MNCYTTSLSLSGGRAGIAWEPCSYISLSFISSFFFLQGRNCEKCRFFVSIHLVITERNKKNPIPLTDEKHTRIISLNVKCMFHLGSVSRAHPTFLLSVTFSCTEKLAHCNFIQSIPTNTWIPGRSSTGRTTPASIRI